MHPSMTAGLNALRQELALYGVGVRVLSTDRTPDEQAALYAQGRTTPGKVVTYARAWESAHNWGLAVDVAPVPETRANWSMLRTRAKALGFGLLGEWDPGHLQHPQWPELHRYIRKALGGTF